MPVLSAAIFKLYRARLKRHLIMGDQNLFRRPLKKVRGGSNRVTAIVHIGARDEQSDIMIQHDSSAYFRFEFAVESHGNVELSGELARPVSTGIVPGFCIFWAGITQARNQSQCSRHWQYAELALGGVV